MAKRGGILPVLLAFSDHWSAAVAKAVNDNKAAQHQLKKLQRHNRVKKDVYLTSYKRG